MNVLPLVVEVNIHFYYYYTVHFVFINHCFGFPQKLVHPTTGIIAVFVALNYCDVVHIAGFGYPVAKNQKHPIHYYGYDTMKSMKVS